MPAWLGMLLVLAILGCLMTGLHLLQRSHTIHPELSRKLVHIGMGVTTLSFPWLFHSSLPVIFLSLASAALLMAVKRFAYLKSHLGEVLGAVERASVGDICFPIAVAILFVVSGGRHMLYWIPIMILTFGDATAALIGVRYGLNKYSGTDGFKSVEGSAALFTVTFLSTHIPLLLFTNTGRAQCLLIGLTIGILVTLLEAIAWNGLDNLFLPLGAFLLLQTFLSLTTEALIVRLAVIVILVVFVIIWRRRTTLQDSALLCAALSGYVFWAIGGLQWLAAPLLLFVTYPLLSARTKETLQRMHSIKSVLSVVSIGLLWLFIANAIHRPSLLYPYTLSFAIQLGLIGIVRNRHRQTTASRRGAMASSILKSSLIMGLAYVLMVGMSRHAIEQFLVLTVVITVTACVFYLIKPNLEEQSTDTRLLIQQAGFAAFGSAFGLIVFGG